jgi:hypothetical protein
MDAATVDLIKTIGTDSIKILGPAIITALVAYKVAQRQLEIKLKELEKTHEFVAREHLFMYYKERQNKLAEGHEALADFLGQILGTATTIGAADKDIAEDMIPPVAELIVAYSNMTPAEIRITSRDMERSGLKDTEDYNRLIAYLEPIRNLDKSGTLSALRKNVFTILEAYHFLQYCNQSLLQREMDKVFARYVKD